jgi:formamidopyrimidine-DNA glycosylase
MPELPEVETIKKQLKRSLVGLKIKAVLVHMDKMIKVGPGKISNIKTGSLEESKQFATLLEGKTVEDIDRRAKFLLIKLSGSYYISVHLRMSGQLIFRRKEQLSEKLQLSLNKQKTYKPLPNEHTHVEITFNTGDKLFFNDHRQFGHMRVSNEAETSQVLKDAKLGPEPLKLALLGFNELVQKFPNKKAKDFLLDQHVIAGIGNIYADESLFMANIHPLRKVKSLNDEEVRKLHAAIQAVLRKAIALKGSSIKNYLNVNGDSGTFAKKHLVYGRSGKECVNCGGILKFMRVNGRRTVYCEYCQRV